MTMRIYVASLSDYNAGRYHGIWIDLEECNFDPDIVQEKIDKMLEDSKEEVAEEWAIHDYEMPFPVDEATNLETLCEIAEKVDEHGEAFAAYVKYVGIEYLDPEEFEEKYQGEFDSQEDFAESLFNQSFRVPESIQNYIDYEKYAHDLFSDEFFSIDSKNHTVFVFSNR